MLVIHTQQMTDVGGKLAVTQRGEAPVGVSPTWVFVVVQVQIVVSYPIVVDYSWLHSYTHLLAS